ncbi:MAG: DUF1304 domain-containing protein [Rhodocyclaceae bacterium]
MHIATVLLSLLVCAIHVWILVIEMFLWDTPTGRRIFRLTPEFSRASRTLAANQGLYNGFLAAGIAWALASGHHDALLFVLGCVAVAGLYGAATVGRKILFVQTFPAAAAIAALLALG